MLIREDGLGALIIFATVDRLHSAHGVGGLGGICEPNLLAILLRADSTTDTAVQ